MKTTLSATATVSESVKCRSGEDGLYLTRQEREVLDLIVAGRSSRQIAEETRLGRRRARALAGSILAELCASLEIQEAIKTFYAG